MIVLHLQLGLNQTELGIYLWEVEGEVGDLVFAWDHVEPKFPLEDHQTRQVGLIA